jgi:CRP-like cAMP-binding protein
MNQSKQKPPLQDLDPLDRVGWLSTQQESFRSWVAENGRWRRFAAGETIYLAGDEPDGMYGLGAGALDVTFPLHGDEPVTLHRAEPGFWIGEAALMAGESRLVSLSAAVESRVFILPLGALRELLARDPACWRTLYEQSFSNLSVALTLLAEALSLSPRGAAGEAAPVAGRCPAACAWKPGRFRPADRHDPLERATRPGQPGRGRHDPHRLSMAGRFAYALRRRIFASPIRHVFDWTMSQ